MHGFYQVWKQHQSDSGNENFSKIFRYDIWRKCWHCYIDLLDIDKISSRGFCCQECGDEPELVVCDATSLGFQRKYSMVAFKNTSEITSEVFPRAS